MIINYIFISILLVVLMLMYFKIAKAFKIVDIPNERSSHKKETIRGGAIIILISVIISYILDYLNWELTLCICFVSIVSFIDDIKGLHQLTRLATHIITVSSILFLLDIFDLAWYYQLTIICFYIFWINAYNFMDGINGIMILYSIVCLSTFLFILKSNDTNFIILLIIASLVFAFFNVRIKAITFAGDVGSISLAVILGYLMLKLVIITEFWEYLMIFSVFIIDSSITILIRLSKRQNIFKAHRSHLYQLLANELSINQLKISIIYATIQIFTNIIVIICINNEMRGYLALLLIIQLISYIILRYFVQKK